VRFGGSSATGKVGQVGLVTSIAVKHPASALMYYDTGANLYLLSRIYPIRQLSFNNFIYETRLRIPSLRRKNYPILQKTDHAYM